MTSLDTLSTFIEQRIADAEADLGHQRLLRAARKRAWGMTPRRPIRNQAHREEIVGYIDVASGRPGWSERRDERAEFWPALFVLLLCFAALVAWAFVAWAAQ